jgi:tRNA nucleotidyltransferase/poly(A) polymerase
VRYFGAARFVASLGFEPDADMVAAMRTMHHRLEIVSAERVRDELSRMLTESLRPGETLRLAQELGLIGHVLPEVSAMVGQAQPPEFHPEGDVFTHTCLMLDALPPTPSPVLALAVLLHDVGKPPTATRDADGRWRFMEHAGVGGRMAEAILQRLRCSSDDTAAVVGCVSGHMRFADVQRMKASTLRRLIGNPLFALELELHRLDCLASHGNLDHLLHITDVQAVAGDLRSVNVDGQVGLPGNLFRVHISAAFDRGQHFGYLRGFFVKHCDIITKQFDNKLRPGAGNQFVDAALNRLAEP